MRADYRLYSEEAGFIRNLFWAPQENFKGNIFLSAEVLGFFAQHGSSGTDKVSGYWRVEELVADLASMGFEEDEVRASVQKLIKWKLLIYDELSGRDRRAAKKRKSPRGCGSTSGPPLITSVGPGEILLKVLLTLFL